MLTSDHTSKDGLDLSVIGRVGSPRRVSWSAEDAQLYAVGIGAGQEDPLAELCFTTENTRGVNQRIVPTFAITLAQRDLPAVGPIKMSQVLHADQRLTLHRPLPVDGEAFSTSTVTAIYDKGRDALIRAVYQLHLIGDDSPVATAESGLFVRNAGGFGGERGPHTLWQAPARQPDSTVQLGVGPGQALIYRLCGDRNPLHSDPAAAAELGFSRPILHGLCTFGYTCRALIGALCDGQPELFGSMSARLSAPVFPGDQLTVAIWRVDGGAVFRTTTAVGVALDHGNFMYRPSDDDTKVSPAPQI
ncbi:MULTISPECIES: MaoC family dehydratase [unclassified Mycobacterium]|uniref:MaoC family dehydratase n=1 Tax=unclassified Mycobacterium TaxID=2642494 RepID=UPI00073FEAE9|nr:MULTISPECIES: MaoC family dehydratase [unclassified Mycobacterium]KUH83130.1 hypothetical protein AU185_04950 [Mycobacterium sp. GA-0227b]KUH84460.1 hypothetical protein AU186_21610 [Mycobacterium sp. GA-1999]KUH89404.1 hypothetical protein AU187_09815 [Mycobacterium sp. IS-1556]